MAALLASTGLTFLSLATSTTGASAAPSDPSVIYSEDFENPAGSEARQTLLTYAGVGGQTYSSDPYWADVNACNGMVISSQTPYYLGLDGDGDPLPGSDCLAEGRGYDDAFFRVQQIAGYLGQVNASADPAANSVVAAYTEGGPSGGAQWSDNIEFEALDLPLGAIPNRFITFSVNAAAINCDAPHPSLQFYVTAGGGEQPIGTDPIDPCTSEVAPGTTALEGMTPDLPGNDSRSFRAGSFIAPAAFLTPAGVTDIGLRMRNLLGTNFGNDHAFDDIRVLDVSPTIDKSFSSPPPGATVATLTLTITNTSELGAKSGWAFTDWLDEGLRIADTPNLATDCSADVSTGVDAGRATLDVTGGVLDEGQESCTISVDVSPSATVSGAASFENSFDNFLDPGRDPDTDPWGGFPSGLTPRDPAQVEFRSAPPAAGPDAVSTPQGVSVALHPVITAGSAPVTSFEFLDAEGAPADTVIVPGEGSWTVSQDDSGRFVPRFTPEPGFTGTATQQRFRVTDDYGQTAESTLDVVVSPISPTAAPDTSSGLPGNPQHGDVLDNDTAGDPAVPLLADTLTLIDGDGTPVSAVTVPGEGTYTVVDGDIVFTPEPGFIGTATPVVYRVDDANGTTAQSTYTPTVTPMPVVKDYLKKATAGETVTFDPASGVTGLLPGSVRIVGTDGTALTELAVPGEGVWTVDAETGVVTFVPERGFLGDPTPVRWVGALENGAAAGGTLTVLYESAASGGLPETGAGIPVWLVITGATALLAGSFLTRRRRARSTSS